METIEKLQIILTEEQNLAVETIVAWAKDKASPQEFKLGGYAGTGKTTVAKTLIEKLEEAKLFPLVAAFTGKAVDVLSRKGIEAQTLHSLMYDCYTDPKTHECVFTKKWSLPSHCNIVIVDESSMLSTELYNDLISFEVKVLFIGDPGQLEPIGDNPNLMSKPDLVLSKIHRQAELSPIITLANSVRLGGKIEKVEGPELIVRLKVLRASQATEVDQVICAKNRTRTAYNMTIRQYKQLPFRLISVGEKLICLRNNMGHGVYNGMIFFVDKIHRETGEFWECDLKTETNKTLGRIPVWKKPFIGVFEAKGTFIPKSVVYCDYGYVITCHKSQGSEWDRVIVLDEPVPAHIWDMKRWRYTAITRAAKQLTYLI